MRKMVTNCQEDWKIVLCKLHCNIRRKVMLSYDWPDWGFYFFFANFWSYFSCTLSNRHYMIQGKPAIISWIFFYFFKIAFCSFGQSCLLLKLCPTPIICSHIHTKKSSDYRCGDTCAPLSSVHWKHLCCVGEGALSSQDKTLLNCFLILINMASILEIHLQM